MKKLFGVTGTLMASTLLGGILAHAQPQAEPVFFQPAVFQPAIFLPAATVQPTATETTQQPATTPTATTTNTTTPTGTTTPTNNGTTTGTNVPTATQQPEPTGTGTVDPERPPLETTTPTTPGTTGTTTPNNPGTVGRPNQPRTPRETQETEQTEELICPTQESLECPAPLPVNPGFGMGQIMWSWIVFIGAGFGGLIWVLSSYLMNSSQARRDALRFNRSIHLKGQEEKLHQLEKAYSQVSNSVALLITMSGVNKKFSPSEIESYKKSAVSLELFGSEETQQAHKNFMETLNTGTSRDVSTAGKAVLNSLRKDLGFKK